MGNIGDNPREIEFEPMLKSWILAGALARLGGGS